MPVELSIEKDDLNQVEDFFSSATERLDDWTEAGEDIVTMIRDDVKLRFQSSPAPGMGGMVYGDVYWRPLREGYLLNRPDRRSGQILIDSGTLKRSVTEDTPESYTEINEEEIIVGTRVPYAERLQREFPFMFWHPILLDRVSKHLADWYLTGKKRNREKDL
ncbi:MAG TPA: hypothetical protein V6C65_04375 [Allocoleopsis sp.]